MPIYSRFSWLTWSGASEHRYGNRFH